MLLNKESQLELLWWIKNIEIYNGRTLIQLPDQALLQRDASRTGWGKVWEGVKTGKIWTQQEIRMRINELELLELKLALQTFLKAKEIESVHIEMNNIAVRTYFLKIGAQKNYKWFSLQNKFWNGY